ncbi:MAG: DUF371 domain-containing protein [Candidatus Hadarchaeota archaeon]|nr:DUF371 domain-containing protein [Candidatus Hadarchaeota archaeon]
MGEESVDVVRARGHPEVTATHPTTLMITRDEEIGPRADCVLAVGADKSVTDLQDTIKRAIKSGHQIEVTIEAGGLKEVIRGRGYGDLTLSDTTDIVIRKSSFICGRTLMIGADKAAIDLRREFVERLRDAKAEVLVKIKTFC